MMATDNLLDDIMIKHMNFKIKNVNNIPTRIGNILNPSSKTVCLIIAGNPGACEMYAPLANEIFKKFQINVFSIGHFGHSRVCVNSVDQKIKDLQIRDKSINKHQYQHDIDSQCQHKIDFIDEYLCDYDKIIIIGHSIGSFCISELLNHYSVLDSESNSHQSDENKKLTTKYKSKNIKIAKNTFKKFEKALMLTPTIEKIGNSENGLKFESDYSGWSYWFLILFLKLASCLNCIQFIFCWLKTAIDYKTINFSSKGNKFNDYMFQGFLQLMSPTTIQNCISMGRSEMQQQPELKSSELNSISNKKPNLFYFLYATKDGWVNSYAPQQLTKECPAIEQETLDGIIHGWSTDEMDNNKVTDRVLNKIREII